jgi:hypothetical protein
VGSGVGEPTYAICGSVIVDGPASAFRCLGSRARDVPYGWNRRVELCPVLLGPDIDWFVVGTFYFDKTSTKEREEIYV